MGMIGFDDSTFIKSQAEDDSSPRQSPNQKHICQKQISQLFGSCFRFSVSGFPAIALATAGIAWLKLNKPKAV